MFGGWHNNAFNQSTHQSNESRAALHYMSHKGTELGREQDVYTVYMSHNSLLPNTTTSAVLGTFEISTPARLLPVALCASSALFIYWWLHYYSACLRAWWWRQLAVHAWLQVLVLENRESAWVRWFEFISPEISEVRLNVFGKLRLQSFCVTMDSVCRWMNDKLGGD